MSHCPQCGRATPFEGAVACPFCGTALGSGPRAPSAAGRTMVGVAADEMVTLAIPGKAAPAAAERAQAPAAGSASSKANRTIVGMPARELPGHGGAPATATVKLGGAALAPSAPVAPSGTIVGLSMTRPLGSNPVLAPAAGAPKPASGTLLGVARPGIAPLTPEERRALDEADAGEPDPPGYEPAAELGATIGPSAGKWPPAPRDLQGGDLGRRRQRVKVEMPPASRAPKKAPASPKRLRVVLGTAAGLALAAVLVALFWSSAPPLSARAKVDADGREGVELRCPSCPDGTKVSIGDASAVMSGHLALVPLPAALSLGENKKKVVIDRPGSGRDETVGVVVNVAYRIRPDLAGLQGDKPAIQIIAEAAKGTTISIDGKALPLSGGRAVESVDVSEACTGQSGEAKTISRQIPYVITPESGPPEQGVVSVSVGVVTLLLEAPGPHVTIDGQSFVLAGKTMKGAEVLAAGRPIAVRPDGTFAQVMNVSSVGATQLDVRARLAGLAPRLVPIKVRRVESLEAAAKDFVGESPINYAPLAANPSGQIGKAIVLGGEVLEAHKLGYHTVILLDVAASSGCPGTGTCTARLVQGAEGTAKKGDLLRVYGHVNGVFTTGLQANLPEIEVDFLLKGLK